MKFLKSIFHLVTLLGAFAATATMMDVLNAVDISAPQQAGTMSIALGFVIIPYCFARAVEQLFGR